MNLTETTQLILVICFVAMTIFSIFLLIDNEKLHKEKEEGSNPDYKRMLDSAMDGWRQSKMNELRAIESLERFKKELDLLQK